MAVLHPYFPCKQRSESQRAALQSPSTAAITTRQGHVPNRLSSFSHILAEGIWTSFRKNVGFFSSLKTTFSSSRLCSLFYFSSWADPVQRQLKVVLFILYTHIHQSLSLFLLSTEVTNYTACRTWQLFTRKLPCLYIFPTVNKLS